jgi:hypothetical protein
MVLLAIVLRWDNALGLKGYTFEVYTIYTLLGFCMVSTQYLVCTLHVFAAEHSRSCPKPYNFHIFLTFDASLSQHYLSGLNVVNPLLRLLTPLVPYLISPEPAILQHGRKLGRFLPGSQSIKTRGLNVTNTFPSLVCCIRTEHSSSTGYILCIFYHPKSQPKTSTQPGLVVRAGSYT